MAIRYDELDLKPQFQEMAEIDWRPSKGFKMARMPKHKFLRAMKSGRNDSKLHLYFTADSIEKAKAPVSKKANPKTTIKTEENGKD